MTHAHAIDPFGALWGHLLPGVMFILAGAWWYRRAQPAVGPFAAPWEAWTAFGGAALGAVVELQWGHWSMTRNIMNYQHATMYLAFAIPAAAFLLQLRGRVAPALAPLTLGAAFAATGLVFLAHGSPTPVSDAIHVLMGGLLLGAGLASAAESAWPVRAVATIRCWLTIVTGTWFVMASQMLPAGRVDQESMDMVMRVRLYFLWHLAGVGLAMLGWHLRATRPIDTRA